MKNTNSEEQIDLSDIFLKYNKINESILYLTLAADKNNSEAQYKLGIIYEVGKLVQKDIEKSIYY